MASGAIFRWLPERLGALSSAPLFTLRETRNNQFINNYEWLEAMSEQLLRQIKELKAEVATLKAEIKRISEADIEFNINNHVRVRLTEDGKAILAAQYEALRSCFPNLPHHTPKREDEDGYAAFQLWDLMQSFGSHIHLGRTRLPFQTAIRFENPLRSKVSKGADDAVS